MIHPRTKRCPTIFRLQTDAKFVPQSVWSSITSPESDRNINDRKCTGSAKIIRMRTHLTAASGGGNLVPRARARFRPAVATRPRAGSRDPGGRGQLVGSAVRMIRAIVTSLPVKRGILSSFENGASDFVASNDFLFQPGSGWGLFFLLSRLLIFFSRYR